MMTQTLLSAATWASPESQRVYSAPKRYFGRDSSLARDARRFQWHRPARCGGHSCLCAVAKPMTQQIAEATLSLPSQILIANPRLTLRINDRKTSPLKISNRKFSTIFRPEFSLFSSFDPPASNPEPNRDTAIKNHNKPHPFIRFQFSNRDKMRCLHPGCPSREQPFQ